MTIEIGSQKICRIGRRRGTPASGQMPIGEADANIFACPACSRPLGVGTSRCPGCGTRLIAGVKSSRAIAFVALGVAVGMIASGGLMALTSTVARPAEVVTPVASAPAIVTPSGVPVASVPTSVGHPAIPSAALSALRQSTLLNQRVVADAGRLEVILAARNPSASDIAAILRAMSSTSAFGARLAPTVGEWDRASAVSEDLKTFYADIARTAQAGLSAALSDQPAFVAAGEHMLRIVAGLDAIDAASRTLAGTADIELPPLSAP